MANTHVELAGSRRPLPHNAIKVRDIDPHAPVQVTVTLKGPKLPSADEMPEKAISREDIARDWGVPSDKVQEVERVLRSYGLQIVDVKQGGRSVRVRGPAAAIIAAFKPDLGIYQVPGQGQIRARHGTLMVPSELADIVEGVFGLDQRRVAKRHSQAAAARTHTMAPLAPADLIERYRFPAGDGEGSTIAIAEFGQDLGNGQVMPPAYIPSDVSSFCESHGLPVPNVRIESVGLSPLNQQQFESEIQQLDRDLQNLLIAQTAETMMDVQIVAGLCPKADIAVYFATWGEGGWVNLLDEVTSGSGPVPVALSISYGLAEEAADWSSGAMDSINQRLQIAAMQGITVCVSSGDDGSGCDQTGNRCHVEFPSSSPFVLSVGGTMLTSQAGGSVDEVVWWVAPGDRSRRGAGATGGGVSTLNQRPAWQTVQVQSKNPHSIDGRVVPDVAALAGAPLYDLLLDGNSFPDGGTSASTPLWAALIARINAALPADKKQRFLTPLLYKANVGKDGFTDIESGQNASHPSPGIGYSAIKGFDAVSGWGVPNGQALLNALSAV
ncbi:kumamolisin (plasmid) [Paraburkholderia sp. PGU19]|uniref:S53 family peptidase n=1 Tax=Paraburkholderia sp. PGU19 TaxID=2735434 RepID=UPI0015DB3EB8|nr:S53 family peptidase [Paraburkholderia sp. PGU19]BCG01649.1 kumamolisin [Paraburkholderia sp. PGU19]